VRRTASVVTATTDFLAPDILDKSGRAIPALSSALHSTLNGEGYPSRASSVLVLLLPAWCCWVLGGSPSPSSRVGHNDLDHRGSVTLTVERR
jgi:hypothetical protein